MRERNQINKKIPIALICDDNYVIPACVTIASAVASKKLDSFYDIYVVCDSLTKENEAVLSSFSSESVSIRVIREELNKSTNLSSPNVEAVHEIPSSALLKFNLPNILANCGKVLCLGCDVLVRIDLSELYSIELGNNLVAAVLDSSLVYEPQSPSVPGYFSSSVILMNLKLMRTENTTERLFKAAAENPTSFPVDQYAFNLVCSSQVLLLPIRYNLLTTELDQKQRNWSVEEINQLYGTKYSSQDDVFKDAAITRFAPKEEPWKNPFVRCADKWFDIYRSAPILHTMRSCPHFFANIPVTVSFTSHPPRIHCVSKVIDCLSNQSIPPNRVVLYLAKEDFSKGVADLPADLVERMKRNKVEIHWCDIDLKPHNKYYHAMQEYPNDIIITVDDDIYLPPTAIEELILCWIKHPSMVIARRVHLITFDSDGKVLPYSNWIHECNCVLPDVPSMQLIATGVGGVLYSPNLLPSTLFDTQAIIETSLYGDDLWLKAHSAIQNIPIVSATASTDLSFVEKSQESGLCQGFGLTEEKTVDNRNAEYWEKISRYMDKAYHGTNLLQKALHSSAVGENLTGESIVSKIRNSSKRNRKHQHTVKKMRSYISPLISLKSRMKQHITKVSHKPHENQ